jgi:hypothetical protein
MLRSKLVNGVACHPCQRILAHPNRCVACFSDTGNFNNRYCGGTEVSAVLYLSGATCGFA